MLGLNAAKTAAANATTVANTAAAQASLTPVSRPTDRGQAGRPIRIRSTP
jgi:hypothetical protein